MIYLKEVVVVEGKYDMIKLSCFLDSLVISTEGFLIFNDLNKQNLIKKVAKKCGIVVLTDCDFAGRKIASFLESIVKDGKLIFCLVPKIIGKEKRKFKKSSEGILGVEAIKKEVIINSLKQSGATICDKKQEYIERKDLLNFGFLGEYESVKRRKVLLNYMGFDVKLSVNQLIKLINLFYSRDKFLEICYNLKRSNLWSLQT